MAFIGIEIQDVALVKVSQYCILESGGWREEDTSSAVLSYLLHIKGS